MHKPRNVLISAQVKEAFDLVPMSRTAAISQAVMNGRARPSRLPEALKKRLDVDPGEPEFRACINFDEKVDKMAVELAALTRLPIEQVIRLCMEAYIHRL